MPPNTLSILSSQVILIKSEVQIIYFFAELLHFLIKIILDIW